MSDPPPIVPGERPGEADKALITLWSELEKGQLELLDAANKRVIELVTALLAVFLAVVAFGKDFPQGYLTGPKSWLAVAVLVLYTAALLAAVAGLHPRDYRKFEHNLSEMRNELGKIIAFKKLWYRFAMWLFAAGTVGLAALIGWLVLQN